MKKFFSVVLAAWLFMCLLFSTVLALKIVLIAIIGNGCASIDVYGHNFSVGDHCKPAISSPENRHER